MTYRKIIVDPAAWFFAVAALCCLIVSIPATNKAMVIFHGSQWGNVATAVFELGAVGLELMSLFIPQWRRRLLAAMLLMLLVTTAFNYALGVDEYMAAQLQASTTYEEIRRAGYGWLLTVAAAALFPGMLGGFLLGFTARARMLLGGYETPLKIFAQWLTVHWLWLNSYKASHEQLLAKAEQARHSAEQDMASLRHTLASREQELAGERQALAEARQALASRPAAPTEEVILVASFQLSWAQLMRLIAIVRESETLSLSTVRRQVAQLGKPLADHLLEVTEE